MAAAGRGGGAGGGGRTVSCEDVELVVDVVGAHEHAGHDVAEEPAHDAADEGAARAHVAAGRRDHHHAHHSTHARASHRGLKTQASHTKRRKSQAIRGPPMSAVLLSLLRLPACLPVCLGCLTLSPLTLSMSIHVIMPAAAATLVLRKDCMARPSALSAEPELKPNQPNLEGTGRRRGRETRAVRGGAERLLTVERQCYCLADGGGVVPEECGAQHDVGDVWVALDGVGGVPPLTDGLVEDDAAGQGRVARRRLHHCA